MGTLVDRQPVAQRMEHAAQELQGKMPIFIAQDARDFGEPLVRIGRGGFKGGNRFRRHGAIVAVAR
jgi:hypothetical protein